MSTNTLAIQPIRKKTPVYIKEMRAVSSKEKSEVNASASVISISDKKDLQDVKTGADYNQWTLPAFLNAYMKGRDNDPL